MQLTRRRVHNADTPGVHLHHRVPHMLSPDQLRLLHPRKRLTPILPPRPKDLAAQAAGSEHPDKAQQGSAKASGDRNSASVGLGASDSHPSIFVHLKCSDVLRKRSLISPRAGSGLLALTCWVFFPPAKRGR